MTADGFVFEGTLAENITATSDVSMIDMNRLEDAMVDACLDPVKFQLDTPVSASSVSGGERLRISLARALYSSGDILLLDEPVSALDPDIAEEFISECLIPLRAKHARSIIIASSNEMLVEEAADYVIDFSHRPLRCSRVSVGGNASKKGQPLQGQYFDNVSNLRSLQPSTGNSQQQSPLSTLSREQRRGLFRSLRTSSAGSPTFSEIDGGSSAASPTDNSRNSHDASPAFSSETCTADETKATARRSRIVFTNDETEGRTWTSAETTSSPTQSGSSNSATPTAVMDMPPRDFVTQQEEQLQEEGEKVFSVNAAQAAAVPDGADDEVDKEKQSVPIYRVIFELYRASPVIWSTYLVIIFGCRVVTYFAQRALSDLLADAPYLGRYDQISNDAKFYMYVAGSIIAECIFLTGCFITSCFGLEHSKNHIFEMLLSAVQKTAVASHEVVHSSGLLMVNLKDNVEKLDYSNYSIAYFSGYFAFTLFVNVFIIEALPLAAIGVGLLLIMWIVLYVWFARRQTILSQAALKAQSTFNAVSAVVVGKVFEIRSHGLGSFLETKLKTHILSATASEYDIEVWARYIELVADVLVSLFCMLFCLYIVIDLSTIAEANSMTRAEVTQRISTRSMAAFYAFAWKSTMSPLVMETNNMMSLLRSVGQMIGLADKLNQDADGVSGLQQGVGCATNSRAEKENDIRVVPNSGPLSLRLHKVQMRYNSRCPLVLKGLSFEAKEGTLTIIKGSSGCGKSSMFLSLLGLYPICGGEISLESANKKRAKAGGKAEFSVSSTPAEVWRHLFAWVPQEPFLFEGTIAENLFPEVDACDLTEEH